MTSSEVHDPLMIEQMVEARVDALVLEAEAQRRYKLRQLETSTNFESYALTSSQLREKTSPAYLIEDLLTAGTIAMLVGAAKSGKTFIALDMALHIAIGKAWCGKKVTQVPVLYIALEGGSEMPKRVEAWENTYNQGQTVADDQFILVSGLKVNIMVPETVDQLVQFVENRGIGLVVIDTWSRSTQGIDENSNTEVLRAISSLEPLINDVGCTILGLHHQGRTHDGPRGASAFEGNLDTILTTKEWEKTQFETAARGLGHDFRAHGKIIDLVAKFQKDLPDGYIHTTELKPVWLREHRGRPDTLVPKPSEDTVMRLENGELHWMPAAVADSPYDETIPEDQMLKLLLEQGPLSLTQVTKTLGWGKGRTTTVRDELLQAKRIRLGKDSKLEWNDRS